MSANAPQIFAIDGLPLERRSRGGVWRRRPQRRSNLRELLFQRRDVHLAQRAPNSRLTGDAAAGGAKGGQQESGLLRGPLRDRRGRAVITEQGTGDHAPEKGPFEL